MGVFPVIVIKNPVLLQTLHFIRMANNCINGYVGNYAVCGRRMERERDEHEIGREREREREELMSV